MEVERQGRMELFAGDCPLRGPLFRGGLRAGRAGLPAGGGPSEGGADHPPVGPVRDLLSAGKGLRRSARCRQGAFCAIRRS